MKKQKVFKTILNLKFEFSVKELEEKDQELDRQYRYKEQLETEKKQVMSDLDAKITAATAKISRLSGHIKNGYEYKKVSCYIKYNWPIDGKKSTFREDTDELVLTEDMSPSEMQDDLFLIEE